jgi:putative transposase
VVFFGDEDRERYLGWLVDYSKRYQLEILAYCLMTTHIHQVLLPRDGEGLGRMLQTVSMRHSQAINAKQGWKGHLWQGRYFSTALDEKHLWAAIRYVEQNPVRAGMVERAQDYRWSSAACHLGLRPDPILSDGGIWAGPVEGWSEFLAELPEEETLARLRSRTQTGVPCGDDDFIERIATLTGLPLIRRPRGRPRAVKEV